MDAPIAMSLPTAGMRHQGLDLADYAQRTQTHDNPKLLALWRALYSRCSVAQPSRTPARLAQVLNQERTRLSSMSADELQSEVELRRGWMARGRRHTARGAQSNVEDQGAALALVSAVMSRQMGLTPYETQLQAAWLMLNGRLVEMATGEGKTLTAALVAGAAGLGGFPVHVLTANEYLVQRDRESMAPLYTALGLSSASVSGANPSNERIQLWQHDIVYATARELVFDYLRDHLLLRGERDPRLLRAQAIAAADEGNNPEDMGVSPKLPGLYFCLIDEADSILLDEAVLPLILAEPTPGVDAEAYRRVYELSCTLHRQRDYTVQPEHRRVTLSDAGRARIAAALQGARGVLWPPRRACELAEAALAARLMYHRDREYVVTKEKIQLIDELTGRIADGRQWQGALQPMVELKEGLPPSEPNTTVAQITYQQFFPRYLQLCGMSGTLLESRHELCVAYGARTKQVPLARSNRRVWQGRQCFVNAQRKWQAVLSRIQFFRLKGRPVLVGTDSVAASTQLSDLLKANGIAHQLLNAVQDADEAGHVARAGQAGMVTIATNMAGRGTDIRLDTAAAAAGGLHVIATMCNRSRRIDRQLFGRAARHGDPGSAEVMLALDDVLLVSLWPTPLLRLMVLFSRRGQLPIWMVWPLFWLAQHLNEWRDQHQRRELRNAERQIKERFGFSSGTE